MLAAPVIFLWLSTVTTATPIQPLPEGTAVSAAARDQADISRLRKELTNWQSLIKQGPQLLLFAEAGQPDRRGPGEVVRVERIGKWPDDTVTSYAIVLDDKRRVRLLQESPALLHGCSHAGRTLNLRSCLWYGE